MNEAAARQSPELRVIEEAAPVAQPPAQMLIDAVTQWEANKKDVSPRGFQKRLQLAYAIFDQAQLMMQETESHHAKLVADLMQVNRRTPLRGEAKKASA